MDDNINSLSLKVSPKIYDDSPTYYPSCDLFVVKNLIENEDAVKFMAKEVQTLPFEYTMNDLHRLGQTKDFSNLTNELPKYTLQFADLLHTEIRTLVQKLFRTQTKDNLTITASVYNKGDYLLCHDDLYGNRHIAFVYYLTENWTDTDGGALRFFDHGVSGEPLAERYIEIIRPAFNSLVLFQVTPTSHHEVQQVFSDKSRLSINGWFHWAPKERLAKQKQSIFMKAPLLQFHQFQANLDHTEIVRPEYLTRLTRDDMQKELLQKTLLLAENFLQNYFYKACVTELQDEKLNWVVKGPSNHRKYEVLEISLENGKIHLPVKLPRVNILLNFFLSPYWLCYLNKVTNLEFAVFDEGFVPPVCMIEVQRWREGAYSLLSDNNFLRNSPSLEITVFFEINDNILGNDEVDSLGKPNASGKVVQSIKNIYSNDTNLMLFYIKQQRIKANLIMKSKKGRVNIKRSVYRSSNKNQHQAAGNTGGFNPKVSKASLAGIKHCVREKLNQIKKYRWNNTTENQVIVPKNNSMLMTMNSNRALKFTSYIQHTAGDEDPKTCYYSVTISYITTCSYDQRSIRQ